MKKSKILIALLTLTLGGISLVSCNNEIVMQDIDKIEISLPTEEVLVGQTLNLNDYVKIVRDGQVVSVDYEAVLTTPATATLNDKTLTIIKEGIVNVRIICGEKTARFNIETLSRVKSKFLNLTKNVGKSYYVDNVNLIDGDLKLSGKGAIHHPYYFAVFHDEATHEDSPYLNKYSGMLKSLNGKSYSFIMDDLKGTNFTVFPGVQIDIDNYYTNQEFPLTVNLFETKDETLISYDIKVTDTWVDYSNGTLYNPTDVGMEKAGLKLEFKNVKDLNNQDKEALIVTTFFYDIEIDSVNYTKDNPYVYLTNAVLFDKNFYSISAINNYIDTRQAPTPLSYEKLKTSLKAFENSKTYTMQSSLSYKDEEGNIITVDEAAFPVSSITTYTNKNGFYLDYGNDEIVAIVNQNNKVYSVTNIDENDNKLDEIKVKLLSDQNIDIWNSSFSSYLITALSSNSILKNLNVLQSQETETISTYSIGFTTSEDFFHNHISLVPGYGSNIDDYLKTYLPYVFLLNNIEVIVTETYISIDFAILYQSGVYYHIENKFMDLNQDKLTNLLSEVNFPM